MKAASESCLDTQPVHAQKEILLCVCIQLLLSGALVNTLFAASFCLLKCQQRRIAAHLCFAIGSLLQKHVSFIQSLFRLLLWVARVPSKSLRSPGIFIWSYRVVS